MKWATGFIFPALLLAAGVCRADSKTESDIRRSVVRILATLLRPNLLKPWMKQEPREITGTGVVLDGQRILTKDDILSDNNIGQPCSADLRATWQVDK